MNGSFTEVKPLFYWVQHILPLVYDDSLSYMELLGKVTKTLNELVENNSLLPDYVMKLIKEYISSGKIEKVLAEVLANYMLNVKFPPKGLTPAVGDGSADDTEAIQGCINYAFQNGGMAVYFPSGAYLTQPLTLNEKVTLFGQDRYTTRIVMKGGATKPLFTGTVDEMSLTGLGFDGNMDIQVNNVNLFTITVNSAIITNCLLTDGYDLLNITVNNELQLDNILFRHAVENALVVGGAGYVQGDNLIFKSLSTLIGKNYIVLNTNKSILEEVKCFGAAPNGVLIGGNSNVVNMWCEACQTPYVDNGANNTIHVYGASEDEKFTGDVTQYIGGFLNQTVVATKKLVSRNVIDTAGGTRQESTTGNKTETVNGNDTETVGGDKKETVSGSKSVIVTLSLDENIGTNKISVIKGTNTETITGLSTENANGGKVLVSTDYNENVTNKNVTAAKVEETLTGNKTVTAANITETVAGYKTVKAGDISNTAENITIHATQDLTEQVDGVRTVNVEGSNNETTGARTENVNGNKSEHVTGVSSETVDGNKTETYAGLDTTATNGETHRGDQFRVLTNKAMQYSKPMNNDNFNPYFSYIPMVDTDGNNYNILVNSNKTNDLLPFISVKSYGAKGDGVTDDTNAIKSALNDLVPGVGGTIYFPTGTYIISETILIGGNVTIYGDGVFNSLIKLADNSNCNIISNDKNTIMYYITIHDIGLDGNAKNNTSGSGILLHNISDSQIYNVRIANFKDDGIHFTANKYSLAPMIYNCFIRGENDYTTGSGIFCDGAVTDLFINNVDIGWCGTAGINLTASNGSSIINAMCWQCGVGLKFYSCQRLRVVNCLADYSKTWGWTLQKCYLFTISNSHSKDSSQISTSFYPEFYIEDSTFILVDNCVAISMGKSKYGLECNGTTNYIKISNSDFSNNSKDVYLLGNNSCIDNATLNICDKNANINVTGKTEIELNLKEYSCDIINVYGTSEGGINIILPKINKIWLIVNATSNNLIVSDIEKNNPVTITANSNKTVYYLNDKINLAN